MIHRTLARDAEPDISGWAPLPGTGLEVTRLPVVDLAHRLPDGTALFARLTYDDALAVAAREGASLVSESTVRALGVYGLQLVPYLGTPTAETGLRHSELHDADVRRQLQQRGWDGLQLVAGAGKHWIAGAPPGRSRLMGWDKDGPGPGQQLWQPPAVAHNRKHFDDGTTTMLERPLRSPETAPEPEGCKGPVAAGSVAGALAGAAAGAVSATAVGAAVLAAGAAVAADIAADLGDATLPRATFMGERGPDVVQWQRWLMAQGYDLGGWGADGYHGARTEAATEAWRAAAGDDGDRAPDTEPAPLLPPIVFKQAHDFQWGRPNGSPIWVVIHTAETAEVATAAENLQSWCTGDINASWHYAVDCDSITSSVRETDRAWTVGPGPAHELGVHIELGGRARQTPAEWRDEYSRAVLDLGARLTADICSRRGIPIEKRGPTELCALVPGLTGHVDVSDAWHRTTHRDPGIHFPWGSFCEAVRGYLG